MDPAGLCSTARRCWSRRRNVYALRLVVAAIIAILLLLISFSADTWLSAHNSIESHLGSALFRYSLPGPRNLDACTDSAEDDDRRLNGTVKNLLPNDEGLVYSVPRTCDPSMDSRMQVTVPQIIWQTARSHEDTPPLGIDLFNSWTMYNQRYDHYFLDDAAVQAFVEAHYNQSVADAFKDMPLGVMRADAVRCAPS